MALTRKMLKAMGIEDEKIDQIIEAHTETVDAIKKERDTYKDDADKLVDVQKKLDTALEATKENDGDKLKIKYDALKEEFDNYKSDIASKEIRKAKETAYRELLKNAGVSEKRIDAVLRVSNLDSVELDENGKIKDVDTLTASVKTEWADFIVTQQTQGAQTSNPPESSGEQDLGKMSMKEYIAARKK